MEYSITHESLLELIHEEVSRVADFAYAEDGTSLYDTIAIFDRDAPTIKRMIADASSVVFSRFRDYIVSPSAPSENSEVFNFYLPDMDPSQVLVATAELNRFLSLQVVSSWLKERYKSEVENYSTRATEALDKAERALFTRKRVTRDEDNITI